MDPFDLWSVALLDGVPLLLQVPPHLYSLLLPLLLPILSFHLLHCHLLLLLVLLFVTLLLLDLHLLLLLLGLVVLSVDLGVLLEALRLGLVLGG